MESLQVSFNQDLEEIDVNASNTSVQIMPELLYLHRHAASFKLLGSFCNSFGWYLNCLLVSFFGRFCTELEPLGTLYTVLMPLEMREH